MLRIRCATAADESAVIAVWRLCGLIVPYNDPIVDFRRARGQLNSDVFVGELGPHGVVATAMVGHDGHRGWIYYVAVHPNFQNRGIGRRIISETEAWLRTNQIPRFQLMVRETNKAAVGFYAMLGFDQAKLIVMQKWIAPQTHTEMSRVEGLALKGSVSSAPTSRASKPIDMGETVRIASALCFLRDNPLVGRMRPELGADIRSFPVGESVLVFRTNAAGIELLSVGSEDANGGASTTGG